MEYEARNAKNKRPEVTLAGEKRMGITPRMGWATSLGSSSIWDRAIDQNISTQRERTHETGWMVLRCGLQCEGKRRYYYKYSDSFRGHSDISGSSQALGLMDGGRQEEWNSPIALNDVHH